MNTKSYTTKRTAEGRLEGRILQQDGARSHAPVLTTRNLKSRKVQLLDMWPPHSPELKAIERISEELHARVGQLSGEADAASGDTGQLAKDATRLIDGHFLHFPPLQAIIQSLPLTSLDAQLRQRADISYASTEAQVKCSQSHDTEIRK
jgi:hypothetical protein